MTIDDPVRAVKQRFEDDERAKDPVLAPLASLISRLPGLPWFTEKLVSKVIGKVQEDRLQKIELLIESIIDELRRLERRVNEFPKGPKEKIEASISEWSVLVVDGIKKAERTRAADRVKNIGRILARALVTSPPPHADDVEEMMRIATELTDSEVALLGELVRIQGHNVRANGRITRYDAWTSWPKGSWQAKPNGQVDSAFFKLESFGLASIVPPQSNINITADIQNRFALLEKGLKFIEFVESEV